MQPVARFMYVIALPRMPSGCHGWWANRSYYCRVIYNYKRSRCPKIERTKSRSLHLHLEYVKVSAGVGGCPLRASMFTAARNFMGPCRQLIEVDFTDANHRDSLLSSGVSDRRAPAAAQLISECATAEVFARLKTSAAMSTGARSRKLLARS